MGRHVASSSLHRSLVVMSSVAFLLISFMVTTSLGVNTKPSLNARRVLLPYNLEVPTNYTLEALDGGCYKWSSSRSDVASVTPIIEPESTETECSSRAVVTAVSRSKRRQSAVILAIESGVTLRADVEVDSIKFIEIITTTREIALDDVPEIFEVHAKNDQNNTFTCLGGIEFEWDLKPILASVSEDKPDPKKTTESNGDPTTAISNLRFRKFSELSYKLDKQGEHEYWEERDRRGSIVLIEGVKTGASRVITRIKDPSYSDVHPSEIQLLVIANIYLIPSDMVYLIRQATISYSVNILKGQQMREMALPTEQYYLDVSDPKIATLDPSSSTVTAVKEGTTSIVLKDRNIKPGIGLRQPTAEVNVMKPSYMSFHVEPGTPGKEWIFQEKTQYIISLSVYDTQHHKMYPSANLVLKVVFPPKFFSVDFSTGNGTYHVVTALQPGSSVIKATLEGASKPDGSVVKLLPKPLTAEQEVNIYPELLVTPVSVFLPWDQTIKPIYSLKPVASGGTGSYRWDSSNTGLVGVNHATGKESAKPRVMTKGRGLSKLTVRDASSHVFVKQIPVEVTDVIDIQAIPGISETPLGSSVFVQLALFGKSEDESFTEPRLFDECSQVPLEVDIVEKTRFTYNEAPKGDVFVDKRACRALEFHCTGVGHSRIWINYQSPNGLVNINTTAVISCFLPLTIVHPGKEGLIALGTSLEVTFEGGPRKWPLNNEGHYSTLNAADTRVFNIKPILDPYRYKKDLHVFRVSCQELGESTLNLRVGNLASATLPNPAILEEHVKITCANPVALSIRPKMKKDENCPLIHSRPSLSKLPVSNSNPIELEINAKDVSGRDFLNITSIKILWDLSDNIIARLPSHRDFKEEFNGVGGFRKWLRNYQVVNPNKKEGEVVVTAKAVSYRADVLSAEGVSSNIRDLEEVKTDVKLALVDKPKLDPQEATLFNHQDNRAVLQVVKGSGHFKVILNPSEAVTANVTYSESTRQVTVKPLADGLVTVRVVDSCVVHEPGSSASDAEASVRIVDPRLIRVTLNEKIELGKETDIKVEVIDSSGGVIPSHFHSLMNLHPVLRSDIVTVKLTSVKDDRYSIYRMKGEKLGRAGLTFATGSTDKTTLYSNVIESSEIKLQVFSPLVVTPSKLKLIVGAQFEVSVTGGPQPESSLDFSTSNSFIATVTSSGLLEAKTLGTFSLTSKSVGHNNLIHSQDSIAVEVVPLHGIKIISPLKQMMSGSEVNLYLYGVGPKGEELDPMSFGSANPKLKITWSVSNSQVLDGVSVASKLGVHEGPLNDFSIRIRGNREGSAVIKVMVEVVQEADSVNQYQIQDNVVLTDNLTLRVFSPLASHEKIPEQIVMSPGSELKLSSSRDGIGKVSYSVRSGSNKIILEKSGTLLRSLSTDAAEAILEVKSIESNGVTQVATYGVQVQPIAFVMLVPDKTLFVNPDSPRKLTFVPTGATVKFHVNFYNVLGQKFDVVNQKPHLRFNRYGLLGYSWASTDTGKLTLVLTALKEGTTIIKVWVEGSQNQEISDFIHVNVGQVIQPKVRDLTVGDVICFSSPLTSPEGQSGLWSEDPSGQTGVLHFFSNSNGVAMARNPGKIKVRQDVSTFITTSNSISVVANQGVFLDARHVPFVSNSDDTEILLPMIVTQASDSPSQSTKRVMSVGCSKEDLESMTTPFTCSMKFTEGESLLKAQEVYSCKVVFSPEANEYRVSLKVNKELSVEKQHFAAALKSKMQVSVQLTDTKTPSVPVIFSFYPAFFVHDKDILLTNQEPLQYIILTGTAAVLKDIQAVAVNEETKRLLDVFTPEVLKDSSGEVTGIQVPLQLKGKLDSLWQTTHHGLGVKVFSPLTKQQEIVSIGVKWNFQEGSQCIKLARSPLYDSRTAWDITLDFASAPFIFIAHNFQTLTTLSCLVLVAVVTFLYWTKSRQSLPVNPNFANSSFHQPTFPSTGSPSHRTQLFSQTSTASPFGSSMSTSTAAAMNPFATSRMSTSLTNRRVFDASSPSRSGSDPDLISSSSFQSPSRPTSSPKGIIGRPLWSQQH